MIEKLHLADCLDTVQLIETIILPSLQRGDYTKCPQDILEMLLRNFYLCSTDSQALIATLPIIPLDMRGLRQPQEYAAADSLIDPTSIALKEIYFDDEFFYPEAQIYQDFAVPLKKCGLKAELDSMIMLDRLHVYTSNRYPMEQISTRAKALLQLPLSKAFEKETNFLREIGSKCWLPACNGDRTNHLIDPTNCRDQRDFHLVGQVMLTLPFKVGDVWYRCFHWQDPITADLLLSQLAFGIENLDLKIVESVLLYMAESSQRLTYLKLMEGMKVVWSNEKCFVKPDIAYQDGCHNLAPYYHNVEPGF